MSLSSRRRLQPITVLHPRVTGDFSCRWFASRAPLAMPLMSTLATPRCFRYRYSQFARIFGTFGEKRTHDEIAFETIFTPPVPQELHRSLGHKRGGYQPVNCPRRLCYRQRRVTCWFDWLWWWGTRC